jgi:hypothetical protein
MSVLRHCPILDRVDQIEIFDHFTWYITAHQFTTVASDSGSVAVGDAAGGVVVVSPSDGSVANNDESYIRSANECFLLAANKKIYGACYLKFTEANVDDANIFFGFANAISADTLVDDGGGLKTSFSGAAIYKVDGGTVWKCVSSVGSTQTITTSTTSSSSSSYQLLEIEGNDDPALGCTRFVFKVDGRYLRDSNGQVIRHAVAYGSATEMHIGAGAKNGADNGHEVLSIDWMYGSQKTIAG